MAKLSRVNGRRSQDGGSRNENEESPLSENGAGQTRLGSMREGRRLLKMRGSGRVSPD